MVDPQVPNLDKSVSLHLHRRLEREFQCPVDQSDSRQYGHPGRQLAGQGSRFALFGLARQLPADFVLAFARSNDPPYPGLELNEALGTILWLFGLSGILITEN
ncbi:hypothetical protein PAAG_07906 [Paracoccidioides lutzii Pb01]|uniref:Uncharacterized protein n=1 Tax=Paracoccidioides lutzii (strain ATCC MYA-826 / Pb01) TaxID=502779 RepID=C1HAS7_PARBA|nr:hypothetical protein PAAG_07906 [Paracoccidioides lutzii Pb01]EEH37488.2 hypothetical protein PAAG_07906 [Paracoccidioides lutzii Pb01]